MQTTAVIAGIDEGGRGALAGPVVAAACFVPSGVDIPLIITDSKKLTSTQRDEAMIWITANCQFGIGLSDAVCIDQTGILAATERAMQVALTELQRIMTITYALVDGRDAFWFDIPHSSIIRGDQTEPAISAASIIAKTYRDNLMCGLAADYPQYGFDCHKGYGTARHIKELQQCGQSDLHRRSFLTRILTDCYA